MLWRRLDEGVGQAEAVEGAELHQALPVVVDLANTEESETGKVMRHGRHPLVHCNRQG